MKYRIGDRVGIKSASLVGAVILGVIVAASVNDLGENVYSIKADGDDGATHEALGSQLQLFKAATPRVLEGATIKDGDTLIACTITRVNPNGTTIDMAEDTATRLPRDPEDFDQPDEYTYAPNPFGRVFTARQHGDGKWYVTGIKGADGERAMATIGVRETAVPSVATA